MSKPLSFTYGQSESYSKIAGLQLQYRSQSSPNPARIANANESGVQKLELTLDADEHITRISGRSGAIIDHLQVLTSKNRTLKAGKSQGGSHFQTDLGEIQGIWGGYGGHLHNIGVYYAKSGASAGGTCSTGAGVGAASAPPAPGTGVSTSCGAGGNDANTSKSCTNNAGDSSCAQKDSLRCATADSSKTTISGDGEVSTRKTVQEQIKELFAVYVKEGMAPNDAAAKALKVVSEKK